MSNVSSNDDVIEIHERNDIMFEDCKGRNKKPKALVDASITLGEQNGVVNEKNMEYKLDWQQTNFNCKVKNEISKRKTMQ
jgi:hypothetical protein